MKPIKHIESHKDSESPGDSLAMAGEVVLKSSEKLEDLAQRLERFHGRFHGFFITRTRKVIEQAKKYLYGLIQSEKRNMERMAEVVTDTNDQELQHFITNSPWDAKAIMNQIACDVDNAIANSTDSVLLVDESAFAKKGRDSVGVARQWDGRRGKVDNCQVGVFTALGCGNDATLIDVRLYLPQEWIDDPERCKRAMIPEDAIVFKTKAQLALEMIVHAKSTGLRYGWVGMDGGYGKDPWLLRALARENDTFVADVHSPQLIFLNDPKPVVPKRTKTKGNAPSKLVAQTPSQRVDKWVANQPEAAWKEVTLRQGTKGTLYVEVLHQRVWLWDNEEAEAHCWHLIVRREIGAPEEIKYSISNAPADTSIERLAYMQGQRYWIELAFRNGKSEAGMGDYQVRTWQGWHHHIAMVMLAMLFMFEVRQENKQEIELLSCHDVVEILRVLLPKANVTFDDVLKQMSERHKRRQASIDSACRVQKAKRHCQNSG